MHLVLPGLGQFVFVDADGLWDNRSDGLGRDQCFCHFLFVPHRLVNSHPLPYVVLLVLLLLVRFRVELLLEIRSQFILAVIYLDSPFHLVHTHRVIALAGNRLDLFGLALLFVLLLGGFSRSLCKIVVAGSGPVGSLGFGHRNRYLFLFLIVHDLYALLEYDF